MSSSSISLGLGLGGGKSATSSGRPLGGGGAFTNQYSGSFDGTNDVAITTGTPVDQGDMSNGYTFSGWMWREDVASLPSNGGTTSWFGGPYASAIDSELYPQLRWYLADEYWNGNVYKLIRWYHGSQTINNSSILIPKGVWSHLAVTWDGSNTVTTFLNGQQIGQITNAGSLVNRADKMVIGRGHFYHKGLVDEVAYWNRGLSSSDITAIYNSGVPDNLRSYSPVGWWRMGDNDDGTGTTITDQGSGGNDATMKNGASFSSSTPAGGASFSNQYSVTLDGIDDTITGANGSLGITGTTWSYCFWARWGTLPASGYFNAFSAYSPTLIRVSSTYFRPFTSGANAIYYPTGGVVANKWYFMAVVQDGTSHSYYVKSSTDDWSDTKTGSSSTVSKGPTIIGSGTSYIDELASFNSALSSSDIDAIYNSGTPTDLSSPASWWKMGDSDLGSGTSVSNEVSGGASLSLQNGASFSTIVPS